VSSPVMSSWVLRQDNLHLLLMHLLKIQTRAGPGHFSSEWDNGEVIAVANLDHESVRIVEEELIDVNPSFLYLLPQVLDPHILQLLLHCSHALTLERNVIILGIDFNFLWHIFRVFRLQKMDSNSITEQPRSIKIERARPPNWDEPKNILVKID